MTPSFRRARLLALLLPALLLAGALGSQSLGHLVIGRDLHPCEMCHWQRWPHYAALLLALAAFALPRHARALVLLAALAILASGVIGLFHAGVEYRWWPGLTRCATTPVAGSGADLLRDIMATPLIRCDAPQWTLAGISLAGFNALFSIGGAAVILRLWTRPSR